MALCRYSRASDERRSTVAVARYTTQAGQSGVAEATKIADPTATRFRHRPGISGGVETGLPGGADGLFSRPRLCCCRRAAVNSFRVSQGPDRSTDGRSLPFSPFPASPPGTVLPWGAAMGPL
jgi:hypothetical protein